jgi:hypothetical protein
MQPALTSRLSLTVPDADAFLADDVAKKAVTNGIADAYNVSSTYIAIKFSKAGGRLLDAALRRMGSSLQIDYTVSVPASAAAAVKQDMLKLASNLTAATIQTAIKARVQVEKGAKFAAGMQVTSLSAPQTVTTTTTKKICGGEAYDHCAQSCGEPYANNESKTGCWTTGHHNDHHSQISENPSS